MRAALLFGLASIAIVSSARTAHALGTVDLEIGAKGGVGTNPMSDDPNPLGFGIGGRAGVVFFDHLYGGVNLMYYFGGSATYPISGAQGSGTYDQSSHTLMYGVEAGWGFKLLDILTIRPQLGLGNATLSWALSSCTAGVSCPSSTGGSENNIYIEPGVTVLLALGTLFVGADANALGFPGLAGVHNVALSLHGQVGVKF
jgi:hypothetical protein